MQRATLLLAGASALRAPAARQPRRTILRSEAAGGWDTSRYGEAGTALTMADESPFASAPQAEVQSVGEGLHGEASCFLPLDQLDNGVLWPRIVRVADRQLKPSARVRIRYHFQGLARRRWFCPRPVPATPSP